MSQNTEFNAENCCFAGIDDRGAAGAVLALRGYFDVFGSDLVLYQE